MQAIDCLCGDGGAAQPLLELLGESDERSQAIASAVSEREIEGDLAGWNTMTDSSFAFTPEQSDSPV